MRKITIIFLLSLIFLVQNLYTVAQSDSAYKFCKQFIQPPFVSDGQHYTALITDDDAAEFKVTFFGGYLYKVVGCGGNREGNLLFTILDSQRNKLFSNEDYNNSAFWNFKFSSTMDCIIVARLNRKKISTGWVTFLIGYKKQ